MKGLNRIQWLSALLLASCLTACQVKRPDAVLSDAKMESVLYDYHIAKAMGEDVPYNESYKRALYIESVYKKYDITKADFDSSMVWFANNPDVLAKIYEKVNSRLKVNRDGINHLIAQRDNKPKPSLAGDSIEVWAWQKNYQLTGMPLDNKVTFVLPSDSNFLNSDTLRWSVRFRLSNGKPDGTRAPMMAMQIQYDNDSIISASRQVKKVGYETISLAADSIGKIKEIRGFIYYPMQKSKAALLADRISLIRYHADTLAVTSKDSIQMNAVKKDSLKKVTPAVLPVQGDSSKSMRVNMRPRPTSK